MQEELLRRIKFELGDSSAASSFMGMGCRLPSLPRPAHSPYERNTLGIIMMTTHLNFSFRLVYPQLFTVLNWNVYTILSFIQKIFPFYAAFLLKVLQWLVISIWIWFLQGLFAKWNSCRRVIYSGKRDRITLWLMQVPVRHQSVLPLEPYYLGMILTSEWI